MSRKMIIKIKKLKMQYFHFNLIISARKWIKRENSDHFNQQLSIVRESLTNEMHKSEEERRKKVLPREKACSEKMMPKTKSKRLIEDN